MKSLEWVIANSESIDQDELQQYKHSLIQAVLTNPTIAESAATALARVDLDQDDLRILNEQLPILTDVNTRLALYSVIVRYTPLDQSTLDYLSNVVRHLPPRTVCYLARIVCYNRLPPDSPLVAYLVTCLNNPQCDPYHRVTIMSHLANIIDEETLRSNAERLLKEAGDDQYLSSIIRYMLNRITRTR